MLLSYQTNVADTFFVFLGKDEQQVRNALDGNGNLIEVTERSVGIGNAKVLSDRNVKSPR